MNTDSSPFKGEQAMKYEASNIELQRFFPEDLIVTSVENNDTSQ